MNWDPRLHPRDKRGEFSRILSTMENGAHVTLPGGTTVRKEHSNRFVVKSRNGKVVQVGTKVAVIRTALQHDDKQREVNPSTAMTADSAPMGSPVSAPTMTALRRDGVLPEFAQVTAVLPHGDGTHRVQFKSAGGPLRQARVAWNAAAGAWEDVGGVDPYPTGTSRVLEARRQANARNKRDALRKNRPQ